MEGDHEWGAPPPPKPRRSDHGGSRVLLARAAANAGAAAGSPGGLAFVARQPHPGQGACQAALVGPCHAHPAGLPAPPQVPGMRHRLHHVTPRCRCRCPGPTTLMPSRRCTARSVAPPSMCTQQVRYGPLAECMHRSRRHARPVAEQHSLCLLPRLPGTCVPLLSLPAWCTAHAGKAAPYAAAHALTWAAAPQPYVTQVAALHPLPWYCPAYLTLVPLLPGSSGPVVLCLHGGGYTGLSWALIARRLKDK